MLAYLKKRIELNQGISISKLPGHLAQLPPEVRAKHGSNEEAIRRCIEKHPEEFLIDKSDRVFLRPPPSPKALAPTNLVTDDVTDLCNVTGNVLRIFPAFGFITVDYPIKTTVYFDVKSFEENRHTTLTTSGLSEGDCVIFDAAKSVGHKASFKATRVKCIEMKAAAPSSASQSIKEPSVDGDDRLHDQSGFIHTVRPDFGFITFGPKKKHCAFFHSSVVDKTLTKGSKNLTDILTVNDRVHFDARPDSKGSKWCKWKATKVWCVPPEMDSVPNSEGDSGDEVFMSEDEADLEGILNGNSELESSDVDVEDYPVGCPDWEDHPRKPLNDAGDERSAEQPVAWSARRKLSGIKGIFFKESDKAGHVFWLDGKVAAQVVITIVYHMGTQIKSFDELPWNSDFEQGVEVFFDAVESDDTWIATLVWIGDRPPRLNVSCSENIFNNVLALAMAETFTRNKRIVATCQPAAPSNSQPSVEIFPDRKGVVVTAAQRMAWCKVQESSGPRQLKFTCLYRDGIARTDCLDKILQEDDVVFVDYMIGTSHGREEVRCVLAWQGQKPLDVACLDPEDFVKLLNARAAEHSSTSSSPEQPSSGPDVVLDASQENGRQSLSPSEFAEQMLGVAVSKGSVAVQRTQAPVSKQDDDTALSRILAHLKRAVRANEGVPLARLQGILSQLPPSVRGRYGATVETIRLVARQFPGTIVVGSDNRVYTSAGPRTFAKNNAAVIHKPPGKKQLPTTKAGAATLKQTGARAVLNASAEVQSFPPPTAHTAEPSVSIYPCVKGTIVQVLDCIATVRVKEAAGTRDIQFTNECLFKDGEVVLDNFSEVLHDGDEVRLNYMVGSRGRKDDVVHCDLVWLGRPPDNAECMGPDEFAKSLGIKASSVGVRATADDLCGSQQEDTVPKSVSGKHAGFAVSHQTVPPEQGHFMENLTPQETLKAGADQAAAVPSFEQHPEQPVEEPQVVPTKSGLANAARCVSPGLSDETLLRLARMVVQEFRAEFREEMQKCVESFMKQSRIVVRDVESQTSADDLRMSSTGESTPPFFSPCSTPTRELDMSGASPPGPELASCQLKFSDTRPEDAVVLEPLELQRVPCSDNSIAHTSCQQDDNSASQPSVQVQSGNVVDMANISDEACDIKPPDEPEGTVASQPLELQKVTPADDTATDTSCELYDNSSSQPPEPVRSESMAGEVRSYSDETADVNSTILQPFEALVTHDNHVEELAVHIGTMVLELSDKSCMVNELSNLSEAADEASLNSAESHNVLPQNGIVDTLLTEKKELSLSEEPEEAPISQRAHENEAQPSNAQDDSVDGIVSQAEPDELDTAPTDTFVLCSTQSKVSVVIETPDPVGSSVLHQTAEDKVPEVSDTCDTALVDTTVLQQTAESEVPDVSEAPDNAIVDAAASQQAAEKKIPGVLEAPGEALADVTGLQRTAEEEAPNLLETLGSESAIETVIPMAANDSSSQPAATLHVLIENDSILPPVLPSTVSGPDASSAELTQEYDAQVNMNSDALKASDISESML
ncbi:uncharacterized protein LOC119431163 isoform X1 [Dermacentor silvarum]|uniref:uncharacterized protein LOC119431163 isoform X1 n=1 Tax=Dermacentor silvarum TaxID=543639 RepID=UPI0018981C75|nr:uncharacterized protein LOC119431163 isoform X1 [Dermacentor silvarum]